MSTMPDKVLVSQLEIKHPYYIKLAPFWQTIRDLKQGAIAILKNLPKYLPKRPDETEDLYQKRLDKFAYTPIMADAVNKYCSKLVGSPIHLSGDDDPFWLDFQANNAHPDQGVRSEKELLRDIFSKLLYFSVAWIAVDRVADDNEPKSRYEELLSVDYNKPYVVTYEPLSVLYWSSDWTVTRQFYPMVEPLKQPKTLCRWTVWTNKANYIYECEVKTVSVKDCQNNQVDEIQMIKSPLGEWVHISDEAAFVPLTYVWQHNIGVQMILQTQIPEEEWVCMNVYLKQIQHLRIENAWTDAGYLSGIVQRLFTPPDPPPANDPRITYDPPDYSNELRKAGNTSILIGKSYDFVESAGNALKNLEGQLDKIESQIRYLISLQFASGHLDQSGVSKMVDMSLLQDAMIGYGQRVISVYNSVLILVAAITGLDAPTASGLNVYSTDQLVDLLQVVVTVNQLPQIPNTSRKLLYTRLCNLLNPSVSPKDSEEIKVELDDLFDPSVLEGLNPEDLINVWGLTPDEGDSVLKTGGAMS